MKCVFCKFFVVIQDHSTGEMAQCHRYAPRPWPIQGGSFDWPEVSDDDWCGEWMEGVDHGSV